MYPIDRREIKALSRTRIRTVQPSPLMVGAAYFIITWVISLVASRLQGTTFSFDRELFEATGDVVEAMTFYPERITTVYQLLALAIDLVTMVIGTGMTIYALRVSRGERAGVGDLFDGFGIFFRIVWLNLVTMARVFLWSLLLFIPGIIASYSYAMAFYLMLDHPEWKIGRCLRESRQLMRGHKWELFMLELSLIGWQLLAVIPIARVYVTPYVELTRAEYYNRLVGAVPFSAEEKAPWEY